MKQNVASQNVAAQMNSRLTGDPITSAVGINVTIDGGTQGAGAGTLSHEGNGHWNYVPTQAETNGAHIAFQFTHATGVYQLVQVYTSFPQTGDGFARLGAPAGVSVSADIAEIDTVADTIQAKTDQLTINDGVVDANIEQINGFINAANTLGQACGEGASATARIFADVKAINGETNEANVLQLILDPATDPNTHPINGYLNGDLDGNISTAAATTIANRVLGTIVGSNRSGGNGTVADYLYAMAAILAGKLSGAGTGTETFRDLLDDEDAVVATVDANGNRTAITIDLTP